MTENETRLTVVGGGAAGLMSAVTAARAGAAVTLLERNAKVGRKLYITGKGRCNVTNHCSVEEVMGNVPRNGRFLWSALSAFPPARTEAFFEELGVPLKVERGNRVFPASDRAADIIDALFFELRRLGVRIVTGRMSGVRLRDASVCAVALEDGRELPCGAAVLATGGLSYPATGSTGDGHTAAAELGHTVIEPRPSLVPLESPDPACAAMQGLSLRNVVLRVRDGRGKVVFAEQGELLFTHFGLSGPLVLSASAHMDFTQGGYTAHIDWKSALDEKTLDERLLRDFKERANQDCANALGGLVPRSAVPVMAERAGIPLDAKVREIRRDQRRALLAALKDFAVPVSGPRPIAEAIVTSGGVKVSEVDPRTMMSKKVPGLFFAGELLDVDAYTGGFNLQIAWCTGRAAGEGAVLFLKEKDQKNFIAG